MREPYRRDVAECLGHALALSESTRSSVGASVDQKNSECDFAATVFLISKETMQCLNFNRRVSWLRLLNLAGDKEVASVLSQKSRSPPSIWDSDACRC
jgi:hypothetical protein